MFVPANTAHFTLDIYPSAMSQRSDNLGYRFSIDLSGRKTGSLHENPYMHGQVTEHDENRKVLVIDRIPAGSRNTFTLGVI